MALGGGRSRIAFTYDDVALGVALLLPDTLTPLRAHARLGIGPPIVRQWRPSVWVVMRRQTTGPDDLAHHDGVIAAVMHPVRRAFDPGHCTVDQWCPAERARTVRNVVELAEQISPAIGKVPGNRLLVDGQQRQTPVFGLGDRTMEAARLADAYQNQRWVQGDRADGRRGHRVLDPAKECGGNGDTGGEMAHDMA